MLLCYFIRIAKVHKVLYLAHKSVQLSDSFPCKFCKILENFVKLVPKLCPFRNFFLSRLRNFSVVLCASQNNLDPPRQEFPRFRQIDKDTKRHFKYKHTIPIEFKTLFFRSRTYDVEFYADRVQPTKSFPKSS